MARRTTSRPRETTADRTARTLRILDRLRATYPDAHCELHFANPLQLLVATILSAQCSDRQVNIVTASLFPRYPTAAHYAQAPLPELEDAIRRIGLFRNKAKNVIALSEIILRQHGGEVPLNREDLEALPGVGRKTASVVLNELGVEPAIAVDTHVFRVSHRLRLSAGKTPDKVEQDLMAIVPEPYLTRAHHWLILHGRYVCMARKPKCLECRVGDLCPSRELFVGS